MKNKYFLLIGILLFILNTNAQTVMQRAKGVQTITFGTLTARTYGDAPFTLTATASSGLTVSYASSKTAVATVAGNIITIKGVGTTNIMASQAGNALYNAAPAVVQVLAVNKKGITISSATVTSKFILPPQPQLLLEH